MNLEKYITLTTNFLNNKYGNMWKRICYTNMYNQTHLIYTILKRDENGWYIEDYNMCDIWQIMKKKHIKYYLFCIQIFWVKFFS